MLRLTEIILPLSTSQDDIENTLRAAACSRLGIAPEALRALTIFRRSYDARKRGAITLTYSVDVEVADEAAVLKRVAGLRTVMPTPPMEYQYVGHAPADLPESRRPVVIGFGPCGLFAALIAPVSRRPWSSICWRVTTLTDCGVSRGDSVRPVAVFMASVV